MERKKIMQTTLQPSVLTKTNCPHVAWFLGLTFGLTRLLHREHRSFKDLFGMA
jgi:hypothetical protein